MDAASTAAACDAASSARSSAGSDDARRDRFRGCLLGLAVGDAVGAAVEASPRGSFPPVRRDVFSGDAWRRFPNPHKLKAGKWTDDTSMALCLAASLLRKRGMDGAHQIELYRRWWSQGLLSSTGRCFDIGNQTKNAITRRGWRTSPMLEPPGGKLAGIVGSNGCIMRLAPVPMAFAAAATAEAAAAAADSARTTHSTAACVDASVLLCLLIRAALNGDVKEEILRPGRFAGDVSTHARERFGRAAHASVLSLANGSYAERSECDIRNAAQVDLTLEAALWAFHGASNFEEGLLRVVNCGGDADTVGAVYGQVAGGESRGEALQSLPPGLTNALRLSAWRLSGSLLGRERCAGRVAGGAAQGRHDPHEGRWVAGCFRRARWCGQQGNSDRRRRATAVT